MLFYGLFELFFDFINNLFCQNNRKIVIKSPQKVNKSSPGLHRNPVFLVIWFGTFVAQVPACVLLCVSVFVFVCCVFFLCFYSFFCVFIVFFCVFIVFSVFL